VPISYFDLTAEEQSELLASAASETGRAAGVIEKDIWVCFVLKELFAMPGRKAMAFKGGTSLSKVYSVIKRFSEDVDITIDYRELGCGLSIADMATLSGRRRDQIGDDLKTKVSQYSHEVVLPYLQTQLSSLGCGLECEVMVSLNGEELKVIYPTRVGDPRGYLKDHVLVEFGGRNIIDPNASHIINADAAGAFPEVIFPSAEGVIVLAPERTFWEKVTLIHSACRRPIAEGRNRVSRHWYDLAMMARHEIGHRAMTDLDLLADVVALKNVFYRSGSAHYDRCLSGELNLIPDAENRARLEKDYLDMMRSGVLNGHDISMAQIFTELAALQNRINQLVLARS
jgi:hypothetical protein